MKHLILIAAAFIATASFAAFDTNNLARVEFAINEFGEYSYPTLKAAQEKGVIDQIYSGKLKVATLKNKKIINEMAVELLDLVARQRKSIELKQNIIDKSLVLVEADKKAIESLKDAVAKQQKVIDVKNEIVASQANTIKMQEEKIKLFKEQVNLYEKMIPAAK